MIARQADPENLESPPAIFDRLLTPNELFYVRNHFAAPEADAAAWRVAVEGAVETALDLSLDDLRSFGTRTLAATLECAGNGRAYLAPKKNGVPWELGAVGTAEWTGAPLAAVLEEAGIRADAVEVVLAGADRGHIAQEPKTPGEIAFARSLPRAKAAAGDVLLAWEMNGEPLSRRHGAPLRAVVPGWYGMASVKWLRRIVVAERPFQGYFQTFEYTRWEPGPPGPTLAPLGEMEVKAAIARPRPQEILKAPAEYLVSGAAWSGERPVERVEVSIDGGHTWRPARLIDSPARYRWSRWEWTWQARPPGRRTLLARAADAAGRVQPMERDPNRRSYAVSHVIGVPVEVK